MKHIAVLTLLVVLCACDSSSPDLPTSAILDDPVALASDSASATSVVPECTVDAINHGDGWGWENNHSCRWTAQTQSARPECTAEAVNHGNGWGWENNASCRWGDSTLPDGQHPECTSAATNQGGGWGWENGDSCRWGNSTLNSSVSTLATVSADATQSSASTDGICSANASDNGDGWGWEYGAPCRWGSVQPGSLNNSVYVPGPVSAPIIGYDNGNPICLTDASDGNDDGFGFENNTTCKVIEGRTATKDNPLLDTRWCQPWAEISYGDYELQNKTWNDSEVYSDNWHQCIELGGSRGNYIAKWDYNWLGADEGNEYSVKSYPQVYYGRKTRNTMSGTPEQLGLPAPLYAIPDYKVRFKYSETGNPERNVALESFFHTSCEAEEWNKQFELMVWVGIPVTKTPGPKVAEVTLDGFKWDVHTNPTLGWGYVAFVAQQPMTEGWLDWSAFVNWTRYNGPAFGVPRIQNGTCMGAIEIGTETFWGQGTFTLHEFRVVRQ